MSDDFSYVGFNDAGDAVAVCIDDPKYKKDTAKTVAKWIRDGRTISRLPHHEAFELLRATIIKRKAVTAGEDK